MDKGTYSFSTCWNVKRHTTGRGMIEEIKELGFRWVELNYNVTGELLATIEPMIERGEIGVSSVHNVFPFVSEQDYGTDSLLLGFEDEERRKRAVELLVRSMDYAQRYGAKAVVVHPGEVPFKHNIDRELKRLYEEDGCDSPAYRKLWTEMLERRGRLAPAYMARIQASLEEAGEHALKKGWRTVIGIETRARCYQIPTLAEAKTLCDGLRGSPVRLWFDIGHAMMMERMGLYENAPMLNTIKSYVYGVHIHETVGLSDHWCPYVHSGRADAFDPFLPIIEAAELKVYELKAACEPEAIQRSHLELTKRLAKK